MMLNNEKTPGSGGAARPDEEGIVFLPQWFSPSDKDVVCGWARQHQNHRKFCTKTIPFVAGRILPPRYLYPTSGAVATVLVVHRRGTFSSADVIAFALQFSRAL